MNRYLVFILVLYIFKEGFEYLLHYLNFRHMKTHGSTIPHEFEGKIDGKLLKKIQEYETEKTRFSFISSLFGNIITIAFIFGGLLNIYNSWVLSFNLTFIATGLFYLLILSYANTVLSIPFSLYSTFKIENKYGFNTTTSKLWILDFIKSILISTIIATILIAIGLLLIQSSPNYWWIWVWGFFLLFSFFMMYISPYVIEPLFNKYTPIEESDLEGKIRELMEKVQIKISRVFKMDASKRSQHTNAYFSGIGKVKRIILYDTLLEKMDHEEIIAVLSHEAGHWKKKHLLKMIVVVELISLIGIYISFRILQTDLITNLFQIEEATFFAKLILLGFIGSIVSFPFIPLSSYISRRFERESDRFAYELTGDKEAMANALIKLSKDNLSNLHPHPLYSVFYYSHPPVTERIKSIQTMRPAS